MLVALRHQSGSWTWPDGSVLKNDRWDEIPAADNHCALATMENDFSTLNALNCSLPKHGACFYSGMYAFYVRIFDNIPA